MREIKHIKETCASVTIDGKYVNFLNFMLYFLVDFASKSYERKLKTIYYKESTSKYLE